MKARITVMPRPEVLDPQGEAVRHGLHSLGYAGIGGVRVGRYVEVELGAIGQSDARSQVEAMCKQLLANEVIEDFTFELEE